MPLELVIFHVVVDVGFLSQFQLYAPLFARELGIYSNNVLNEGRVAALLE
jgi:hypothetical protein